MATDKPPQALDDCCRCVHECTCKKSPRPLEELVREAHGALERIDPIYRNGDWTTVGKRDAKSAIDSLATRAREAESCLAAEESSHKATAEYLMKARDAALEEAASLIRERLRYNDYQQPLFSWHDVQDLLNSIRALRASRGGALNTREYPASCRTCGVAMTSLGAWESHRCEIPEPEGGGEVPGEEELAAFLWESGKPRFPWSTVDEEGRKPWLQMAKTLRARIAPGGWRETR